MDIDEIICRVAPNLAQSDGSNDQNSPSTVTKCHQVTMIPFLKRSATSIDMDALLDMQDDDSSCQPSCKNVEVKDKTQEEAGQRKSKSVGQLLPFNSLSPTVLVLSSMSSTDIVQCDESPSSRNHLLLATQSCSSYACVPDGFLSTHGSMDSFSTVFEI